MKKDFFKLSKHVFIYGLGKSSYQIIGLLLLPIYTRYLTPTDYGILSLINFFTGLVSVVFVLGTHTSVFRFYKSADNESKKMEACYSSLLLLIIWCSIIILTVFPFREKISLFLFDLRGYENLVMMGLCATAITSISGILMFILRAEENSTLFIANNLLRVLFRSLIGIFLIVILERSVLGAIEANLITSVVFLLLLLSYRLKKTKIKINYNTIKEIIGYGYPLVFHGFGWIIMTTSDKYFLKYFFDLNTLGIYSVSYTFGVGIMLFVGAFGSAWPQMMFNYSEKKNVSIFYGKTLTYYTASLGLIWLVISLFSEQIVMTFTKNNFWGAHEYVPLIMLAYVIHGAFAITSSGIYAKDKTKLDLILTPLTVLVCLLLNYFLIKNFGMDGAAWATLLSFSFQFILYSLISNKYILVKYQKSKLFIIVTSIFSMYIINKVMPDIGFVGNTIIKFIMIGIVMYFFYRPSQVIILWVV